MTNPPATGTTTTSQVDRALSWLNQNQDQASKAVANAAPALMSQLRGVLGGGVATSAPQAITATSDARSTGTSTASLASQSFALLNQYLAGSTGRGDSGQIVASLSNGASCGSGIVPDQTATLISFRTQAHQRLGAAPSKFGNAEKEHQTRPVAAKG